MSDLGSYFDELDQYDQAKRALDRSLRSATFAPEVAARQRQLSQQTGIPAVVIPDFQKQAEEEAAVRQVQRLDLPRTAPTTAAWLAVPENAAIARDEADKLSFLEKLGNSITRGFKALDQGGSAVAAKSNARVLANLDEVEKRLAAGQPMADAEDMLGARYMTAEDRKALRDSLTSAVGGSTANIVKRQQEMAAGPQMDPVVSRAMQAKSLNEFWYFFSQKPVEFIATVGAESLPQSLPGLAAGIAGGIAAGPGGAMLGFGAGSFGTDYGASVVEAMRDSGVDLGNPEAIKAALADKALMAKIGQRAFAHAAPVAAFDAVSGRMMTQTLAPQALGRAARQAVNMAAQSTVQGVSGIAGEAAGLAASGQEITAGALMAEFFGEFATAPGEVVSMTATRGREAYRAALKSFETKATLDAMASAAEQSALLKRDPEAFRSAMEAITRGTGSETLYVPVEAWQRLFQDANPRAVAQEVLGPLAARYDEALATGGDIAIPTADVLTKLAPTKFWQALSEDIRTAPDEMTPREAREFAAVKPELEAQVGTADAKGPDTAAIGTEITGQLVSAGVERGAAEKQAKLYEAFFRTLAERLGTDPVELFKRYSVNIKRQLPDVLTKLGKVDMTLDPILDNLRAGKVPQQRDIFGPSLIEFLRSRGGLRDDGGELRGRDVDVTKRPFQRNLIQPNGLGLDAALEAARQAGYLPDGQTEQDLLDAIDSEMRGEPVFSMKNENQPLRAQYEAMNALDLALAQAGIDLKQTSNADIAAMLAQMGQDGQRLAQSMPPTIDVDGTQRPTTNSEGRPIAATEDAVRNFWRWFGDSRVVDAEGRPLVVYHGTASDIEQFQARFLGRNTEARSAKQAFFFTASPSVAEGYAKLAPPRGDELGDRLQALWERTPDPAQRKLIEDRMAAVAEQVMADWQTFNATDYVGGANILPVYLRLTEPLSADYGGNEYREFSFSELLTEAKDEGRDGAIFHNARDGMHKLHNDASDIFAVFDPTQIKSATGNAGTFDPANPSILFQSAFHGSPHVFDKFSLGAIGTGEGQQVFGWGLYFTENRQIAEHYRKTLSDGSPKKAVFVNGERVAENTPENHGASLLFFNDQRDIRATAKRWVKEIKAKPDDPGMNDVARKAGMSGIEYWTRLEEFVRTHTRKQITVAKGQTYEVEVPDDDVLLLWDSPMGSQPDYVKEKLKAAGVLKDFKDNMSDFASPMDTRGKGKGENLYNFLAWKMGGPEAASRYLNSLGIPGHKFRTNTLTGRPGKDFNFVIWDDAAVKMLRTFYQDQRGFIQFGPDRQRFDIVLMETADLSTFLHETGHFFLEVFKDAVADPAATPALQADFKALLDWFGVESADQITVKEHEQFARGFEAYLREGKAPSPELAAPFARFRAWLVSLYRSLTQLNVTLTDEVRGVFDRLLAADDEIALASTQQWMVPMFDSPEAANMTPEQFARYRDQVDKARQAATDDLTNKTMAAVRRETQAWYRDARDKMRGEVAAEVNAEPVYQALAFLQRGKQADGSALPEGQEPLKISKQSLVDAYGEAFLKRLPKPYVYAREGGVHQNVIAELFGFSSGDALVQALIEARPKKDLIEAETDVRMRDTYGDVMTDGTIAEEAMASVHNDQQAALLLTELRHLAGNAKRTAPTALGTLREAARGIIARKTIRELNPRQYQRDEAKAGREAFTAAAKQDFNAAFLAKQRQTFSHLLYTEAIKAQEAADKARTLANSLQSAASQQRLGKAGGSYLDQVNAILERFEWKRVSVKTLDRRQTLVEWLMQQDQEPDIPAHVLDEAFRKNWRELTVEELAGVKDSLDAIVHMSRLKNRLLKIQAARTLEDAVGSGVASIIANSKGVKPREIEPRAGPMQRAVDMVGGFFASHRKAANLLREMDGFQDAGVLHSLIMQPMNEAANAEASMNAEAAGKLAALWKLLDGKRLHEKREFKLAGVSLSKNGALAVALNWGNLDNRQKLLQGYGWSEAAGREIIDSLDAREWEFVQGVWDLIDSYWPQIAAKEKRVNGVAPEKVEAAPIETRFGKMRGGYYPIKGDDRQTKKAGEMLAKEAAEQMLKGAVGRATTRRGHTKERVANAEHVIRLDLGVVFEHVTQVVHDLTHHEMLIDVNRLLNSDELSQAIIDHHGHQAYKQLSALLRDVAAGYIPAQMDAERAFGHLRNGVTVAGMGWNVATAAMQALGFTQSMARVGPMWIAKGIGKMLAAPETSIAWVHQQSEFMRNRGLTQNREINDIRNRLAEGRIDWLAAKSPGFEAARAAAADSMFVMIAKMQMMVDVPTWLGAYWKAIEGGSKEEQAAAIADQAVIDAQGGGQIKDLAQVQRGSAFAKLWTTFYSYMSVTWNLWVDSVKQTDFRKPGDIGRLMVDFVLLYTLPAVLATLMKDALKGEIPDEDELLKKLAREHLSYMTGSLIGVRELSSAVAGMFDYQGPAGARFFSEASKLVKQTAQGDIDEPLLRAGNQTLGMLLHYPAGQVQRTVQGYLAWQEGTAPITAVLFGPPKD